MSFLLAGTALERNIGLNPYPEFTLLRIFIIYVVSRLYLDKYGLIFLESRALVIERSK